MEEGTNIQLHQKKWSLQSDSTENGIIVIKNLLLALEVNVNDIKIQEILMQDPDYPSILSLSSALDFLKIGNMTVKLDENDLNEIPLPAIAHMIVDTADDSKSDKHIGHFVTLIKVEKDHITYIDPEKGICEQSKDEFISKWSGIVLLVEVNATSGDPNFKKEMHEKKIGLLKKIFICGGISTVFLLFITLGIYKITWQMFPILLVKSIGALLSIVLISYKLQKDATLINKICNLSKKNQNSNSDCVQGVLNSPAAKLWDTVHMAEVGLLYFISTLSMLSFALFLTEPATILFTVAIINILALPYTLFSFYYQGIVLKKWCKLCVVVQIVVWIEFISFLFIWKSQNIQFTVENIVILFICLILPVVLWMIVRSKISAEKELLQLKKIKMNFETNPMVLEGILKNSMSVNNIVFNNEIFLGDPKAKNNLILYTDPFCKFCKEAHQELELVLHRLLKDTKIIFRFTQETAIEVQKELKKMNEYFNSIPQSDKKHFTKKYGKPNTWEKQILDQSNKIELKNNITKSLFAISQSESQEVLRTAIHQLFDIEGISKNKYNKWMKSYGNFDIPMTNNCLEYFNQVYTWSLSENLISTPTLVINGKKLDNAIDLLKGIDHYLKHIENKDTSLENII